MIKNLNNKKAITLIALIITILILLILTGVSILLLSGENGILNKANIAKRNTEEAQIIEESNLGRYNEIIDGYTGNARGQVIISEETLNSLISRLDTLETKASALDYIGTTYSSTTILATTLPVATVTKVAAVTVPAGTYLVESSFSLSGSGFQTFIFCRGPYNSTYNANDSFTRIKTAEVVTLTAQGELATNAYIVGSSARTVTQAGINVVRIK